MRTVRTAKRGAKAASRARTRSDDIQKEAIYQWEIDNGWVVNIDPFDTLVTLIRDACEVYGVQPPYITQHFVWADSYYLLQDRSETDEPDLQVISLQAHGNPAKRGSGQLNKASALHETAHHVCWMKWGYRLADHGPTFMGVYRYLLYCYNVKPILEMDAELKARGIRVRQMSPGVYDNTYL